MTTQDRPGVFVPRPAGHPETTEEQHMTTDQNPDRAVCICGHPKRQHFEDVCITEITGCDCGDFLPTDAAAEEITRLQQIVRQQSTNGIADHLPARLEAVLTERFTELGNPFSGMRRHEQGPDGWPASHPVGPHQVAEVLRELLTAAPAVVAQPGKEADRG
jgi:hypothetical protein